MPDLSPEPLHASAGDGSDLAVRTRGLTKRIGRRTVVSELDLGVPRGSVTGLLGPDGSGKTTTIRLLLGLTRPTRGEIELLGAHTPARRRQVLCRVGATVARPAFHPALSGAANLARLDAANPAAPKGSRRSRLAEALERTGLTEQAGRRVRHYSPGELHRLALAAAVSLPRDLLVLDQPTDGLDDATAARLRVLFATLTAEGTTVLIASPRLAELQPICTGLALLRDGELIAQAPIGEIGTPGPAQLRVETPDAAAAAPVLHQLGLGQPEVQGDVVSAAYFPGLGDVSGDGVEAEDVVAALVQSGVRVRGLAIVRETLADRVAALYAQETTGAL